MGRRQHALDAQANSLQLVVGDGGKHSPILSPQDLGWSGCLCRGLDRERRPGRRPIRHHQRVRRAAHCVARLRKPQLSIRGRQGRQGHRGPEQADLHLPLRRLRPERHCHRQANSERAGRARARRRDHLRARCRHPAADRRGRPTDAANKAIGFAIQGVRRRIGRGRRNPAGSVARPLPRLHRGAS